MAVFQEEERVNAVHLRQQVDSTAFLLFVLLRKTKQHDIQNRARIPSGVIIVRPRNGEQ